MLSESMHFVHPRKAKFVMFFVIGYDSVVDGKCLPVYLIPHTFDRDSIAVACKFRNPAPTFDNRFEKAKNHCR